MRRTTIVAGSVTIALLLTVALASCDKGPTEPSAPLDTAPGPAPVTATRVEIIGPESIPPGESVQFRTTASFSDGTTRDVTGEAVWQHGNPQVLTVSSTGLVTAHGRGETSLSVFYGGRQATRSEVFVLPAGTYRIRGAVRDEGYPVVDAQVAVLHGSVPIMSTTSYGEYRLYGVSGPTELRVTRTGYAEQRRHLNVTTHETVDFDLLPSAPRPNLAGTFRLAITAARECAGALPPAARTRSYTAHLTQNGPRVEVTLSGATFREFGGRTCNRFFGNLDTGFLPVVFYISRGLYQGYYGYYSPDLLEQLDDISSLLVSGNVYAGPTGNGVDGTLVGKIQLVDNKFQEVASCDSNGHQFMLSR